MPNNSLQQNNTTSIKTPYPIGDYVVNGIPEFSDNYVYTPNQLFDYVLPNFSIHALRIVCYLIRQSLGYTDEHGKPKHEVLSVSRKDFCEIARVSKAKITEAIQECLDGNLIIQKKDRGANGTGRGHASRYELKWHKYDDGVKYKDMVARPTFKGFARGKGRRTPIPNMFFDQIVCYESLPVSKVVGMIIRNTIGYEDESGHRRKVIDISYSQIRSLTKISHDSVLNRAINHAIYSNYIIKKKQGFFNPDNSHRSISSIYAVRWVKSKGYKIKGSRERAKESGVVDNKGVTRASEDKKIKGSRERAKKGHESERIKGSREDVYINNNKNNILKQQQGKVAVAENLDERIKILMGEEFDRNTAATLAQGSSLENIRNQVAWLPKRNPKENPLGLLRRAIEEEWENPEKLVPAQVSDKPKREGDFIKGFYAGYAGIEKSVSEPSKREMQVAEKMIESLQDFQIEKNPETWGKDFGKWLYNEYNFTKAPSFSGALKYGDAFISQQRNVIKAQHGVQKRKTKESLERKREAHLEQYKQSWIDYLRGVETSLKVELPSEYKKFLDNRNKMLMDWEKKNLTGTMLENFKSEEGRLTGLPSRFSEAMDFWEWDKRLNPEKL